MPRIHHIKRKGFLPYDGRREFLSIDPFHIHRCMSAVYKRGEYKNPPQPLTNLVFFKEDEGTSGLSSFKQDTKCDRPSLVYVKHKSLGYLRYNMRYARADYYDTGCGLHRYRSRQFTGDITALHRFLNYYGGFEPIKGMTEEEYYGYTK